MNLHILHPTRKETDITPNFATGQGHRFEEHVVHLHEQGNFRLRPIHPDDEARMIRFHESLSEENIFLRYFEHISLDTRTLHERLARVCTNTADSYAIVIEQQGRRLQPSEILGVGRLTTTDIPGAASFAILLGDEVGETKLPQELIKRLIIIARAHGFHTFTGELLVADHDTLNICRKLGFDLKTIHEDGIVTVTYPL